MKWNSWIVLVSIIRVALRSLSRTYAIILAQSLRGCVDFASMMLWLVVPKHGVNLSITCFNFMSGLCYNIHIIISGRQCPSKVTQWNSWTVLPSVIWIALRSSFVLRVSREICKRCTDFVMKSTVRSVDMRHSSESLNIEVLGLYPELWHAGSDEQSRMCVLEPFN